MNRRTWLLGAGALTIAGCGAEEAGPQNRSAAVVAPSDPFSGEKLFKDVETYVSFGTHRSGSKGDLATSDWLAKRWKELGYRLEQSEFPLPNADTTTAKLEVGGETFEGFAQPPLSFTPPNGLSAPLGTWNPKSPADVTGRIAIVHVERAAGAPSPSAAYRDAFERCGKAGAKGVLAVISGPSGEVVAINTPVEMMLETPVLMIGEKDKARIEAAAAKKGLARLTILGPGGFRNGKNTIAKRGEKGPWVIISTPQSGWFTCGGERGPGIAMSRALSEWAVLQKFAVRFLFIATSGHEWTDFGAHLFHQSGAPEPKETALWFHLGASFGARAFEESPSGPKPLAAANAGRTLMASNDILPLCQAAFAGQKPIDQPVPADAAKALGEYTLVLKEGYPSSAGFWGFNTFFHTPLDGVEGTTGEVMAPLVRAIAKVIEARVAKV